MVWVTQKNQRAARDPFWVRRHRIGRHMVAAGKAEGAVDAGTCFALLWPCRHCCGHAGDLAQQRYFL